MSEQKIDNSSIMDLVRQYRHSERSELSEIADEIIKQIEILKLRAALEFKEQSVPEGYMLVMAPQEFENEPDWDDIKRQAEEASGFPVEQHTYSMVIREVRRWLSSVTIKPKSLNTSETNKKSDRTCSTCKHSDSWGLPDCVMPGSCGPDRLHYEPLNKQYL